MNEPKLTLLKNGTNIAEKALVVSLKSGNAQAFDQLFANYGKRLYYFSLGYLKSKEEAEEVVQEVFLTIWRKRKDINPDLSFKAYIFKIAYHQILERFRQIQQRQNYHHQLVDTFVSFSNESNERLDYQLLLEKVETLVQQLPPRQQDVLLKIKKDGMPVKEVALQLNISPKTVENHLTQALKNIKKGLLGKEIASILFFLFRIKY